MGRIASALSFIRHLLEGKKEERGRTPWLLDSFEKVLLMWPELESLEYEPGSRRSKSASEKYPVADVANVTFAHLRRLYRYGFRLTVSKDGLRIRQFFADGELYRPEGYRHESEALLADLAPHNLVVGQCRAARAKPVLKALGFLDLDTPDSYAIQFAALAGERWIFIDSRPEVFRRETSAKVAAKLAQVHERLSQITASPLEGPSL